MYWLFDEELERRRVNLESAMVDHETKVYTNISKFDGNNVKTLIFVNEEDVYHTVITRVIENIPPKKLIDFHKLANELNNTYSIIRCVINEENHFDVNICYTANEDSFSANLFFQIIVSYLKNIENDIFPRAMGLKYSF